MGLTPEKLEHLKTKLETPQWNDLIARMNHSLTTGVPEYGFGAFHFAVAYAVTGNSGFADMAKTVIFRVIDEEGYCPLSSTYLYAPGCTGQVAWAADIILDRLTDAERNRVFDYLETAARDIIEVNGWSGWGWLDGNPHYKEINNYYPGHLQTILNYALLAYEYRESARAYYDLVVKQELPRALEMMSVELAGGHGAEGTWYDDKLFGHYAEVILMLREATEGGVDFGKAYAKVFADYLKFRLYAFNPLLVDENGSARLFHLPTGDQPAVAGAEVIDLSRLRLWLMMDLLKDTSESEVAGYVRHFEENVNYTTKGWQREYQLHWLLHYDGDVASRDYTQQLNRSYLSAGKGVAHYRTGWGTDDLTAAIHFSPGQGQRASHWHFGEGAFYVWYKGWQADHLNRLPGSSGVEQNTGLMNTLLVNRDPNSQGSGDAKVLQFAGDGDFMVVKGEATANYKGNLDLFERTFIVSGKVITVFDRVKKKTADDVITFQLNSASGFEMLAGEPGKYTTVNHGGRLTVQTMLPADSAVTLNEHQLLVDFDSADAELHLLHAMEAGDAGSPSADMFLMDAVVSDAGSFTGVRHVQEASRACVHLVNRSDDAADTVSYDADHLAVTTHVITGLAPGNYTVQQDGNPIGVEVVDSNGVLHFTSASGGQFTISK